MWRTKTVKNDFTDFLKIVILNLLENVSTYFQISYRKYTMVYSISKCEHRFVRIASINILGNLLNNEMNKMREEKASRTTRKNNKDGKTRIQLNQNQILNLEVTQVKIGTVLSSNDSQCWHCRVEDGIVCTTVTIHYSLRQRRFLLEKSKTCVEFKR